MALKFGARHGCLLRGYRSSFCHLMNELRTVNSYAGDTHDVMEKKYVYLSIILLLCCGIFRTVFDPDTNHRCIQ